MKIKNWQKIFLSLVFIYVVIIILVLANHDICTSIFFSSFCNLDNRYLWCIMPAFLFIILMFVWGKEISARANFIKTSSFIMVPITVITFLFYSFRGEIFPDRCNKATAKMFIFSELKQMNMKSSRVLDNKNEFFEWAYSDIYDTGITYYGYNVCQIKNNIFQFGNGSRYIYYYYDPILRKHLRYPYL